MMRKLPQPYNSLPTDLTTLSSDALHEWYQFLDQEAKHYKTLEPDKAYTYHIKLTRVTNEMKRRKG
jgi:hypothetical protein